MSARRVVVTGLGVICALGNNTSETWNAVSEGRSGIAPIRSIDLSKLRFRNGAQVCGYDPSKHFEASRARLLDPFSQFAVIQTCPGALREGRDCDRLEHGRPVHARRRVRETLPTQSKSSRSPGHSSRHGECGRQPYLNGVWHNGTCLHDLYGLLFLQPCHRPSFLDGSQWGCRTGHCRWQRGSFQLWLLKGLGGPASYIAGYVPAFLQRPAAQC